MFPAGVPGVGLIILRLCALGASIACVLTSDGSLPDWPFLSLMPILVLLILGFLTPLSCLILLGIQAAIAYRFGMPGLWHCWLSLLLTITVLAMGPGAYSCDAILFGRQKVIIRRQPPDTKPPA
jgi:hypothetical protein